jgi:hypothetical protein
MSYPRPLTRDQLEAFLGTDHRAIRAFEKLFDLVPSSLDDNSQRIEEVGVESALANAAAQDALAGLERLLRYVEPLAVKPAENAPDSIRNALEFLSLAPNVEPPAPKRYGVFYDTTTQTAAAANTAYAVTFNTTDLSFGVSIGSPTSRVVVDTPGVYNFQFSCQLDKTTSPVGNVWIWARINGVNVANSATQIRIQGNNAETVAAWNFVFKMKAGDYFELMWAADDNTIQIQYFAAAGVVPAIPSILLSVTSV